MQVWFRPFEKALAVNIKGVQVIVCVDGSDLSHLMQWSVSYLLSSGNHTPGSVTVRANWPLRMHESYYHFVDTWVYSDCSHQLIFIASLISRLFGHSLVHRSHRIPYSVWTGKEVNLLAVSLRLASINTQICDVTYCWWLSKRAVATSKKTKH